MTISATTRSLPPIFGNGWHDGAGAFHSLA
jgi:hypothetical protein